MHVNFGVHAYHADPIQDVSISIRIPQMLTHRNTYVYRLFQSKLQALAQSFHVQRRQDTTSATVFNTVLKRI